MVNVWWQSPVWEVDTGLDCQFNQGLLDEVYSIANGIQSKVDLNPHESLLDYDLPHINRLKALILETVSSKVTQYINLESETAGQDIQFKFDFGWVNVKGPGQRIEMHSHTVTTLTATYYLKVPKDSGNITFLDTSDTVLDRTLPVKFTTITPVEGSLIFFPSYILHEVEENRSDELRISLSVDMSHSVTKGSPNAPVLRSWVEDLLRIKDVL